MVLKSDHIRIALKLKCYCDYFFFRLVVRFLVVLRLAGFFRFAGFRFLVAFFTTFFLVAFFFVVFRLAGFLAAFFRFAIVRSPPFACIECYEIFIS